MPETRTEGWTITARSAGGRRQHLRLPPHQALLLPDGPPRRSGRLLRELAGLEDSPTLQTRWNGRRTIELGSSERRHLFPQLGDRPATNPSRVDPLALIDARILLGINACGHCTSERQCHSRLLAWQLAVWWTGRRPGPALFVLPTAPPDWPAERQRCWTTAMQRILDLGGSLVVTLDRGPLPDDLVQDRERCRLARLPAA